MGVLYRVSLFNLSQGRQWNQAVLDVRTAGNLVTAKNNFGADFTAEKGSGRTLLVLKRLSLREDAK